ncbi:MAG: PAS domain-containing protein [Spirochaetaceae bacterium]
MSQHRSDLAVNAEERSELLETLLEAIGVPFLVVAPSLRVLFFSQAAASLFGLRFSDIGRGVGEVLPPQIGACAVQAAEDVIRNGGRKRVELGADLGFPYDQRAQVLEDPDGEPGGAVLTYLRVPWHSAAERQFEALLDFYESMLTQLPDQIARLDTEGRFVYVNAAAAAMAGCEVEEMVGATARELGIGNRVGEMYSVEAEYAIASGEQISTLVRAPFGGRKLWLLWRLLPQLNELGSVLSVLSIATDVTSLMDDPQGYGLAPIT